MVMRRAGKASPEAISAERTRSRASETSLSGRPTMANAGIPGANLYLHVDRAHLDALEGNCGNPLDHFGLTPSLFGAKLQAHGSRVSLIWAGPAQP